MTDLTETEEEEKYTWTPWGCFYVVLKEYKVDCDWISGKVGTHIVEDFMENMEKCGYISKAEKDE